jgi:hypothetical protein
MIETPLFPLQSIYDPLQKGASPTTHGEWLASSINSTILSKQQNGAWLHSCERHCGSWSFLFFLAEIVSFALSTLFDPMHSQLCASLTRRSGALRPHEGAT